MASTHKPIFLLFCADQTKDLNKVRKELDSIESMLWKKFSSDVICKSIVTTTLDQIHQKFEEYREHVVVFHFAGHAVDDNLILEDCQYSSEDLAVLMKGAPNLKLIFLNACHTQKLRDALIAEGLINILATSASIGDDNAFTFAIRFYTALTSNCSFSHAYELAISLVKKKFLDTQSPSRGPISREISDSPWAIFNRDKFILDTSIKDLIAEASLGIIDMPPSQLFRPDSILCRLDRREQDMALARLEGLKSPIIPLVLCGEDLHLPYLYIQKLMDCYNYIKLEYSFPFTNGKTEEELAQNIAFDIYSQPRYISGLKYQTLSKEKVDLHSLIRRINSKKILIVTVVEPHKAKHAISGHYQFWKQQFFGESQKVICLLIISDINTSSFWNRLGLNCQKAAKYLKSWCLEDKSNRYHLPPLNLISRHDRQRWEMDKLTKISPLNSIITSSEYFEKIDNSKKPLSLKFIQRTILSILENKQTA